MSHATRKISELGISFVLVAAMIAGGGTSPGLTSDSLLLSLTILTAGGALLILDDSEVDWRLLTLALACIGAVLLQLVPLPELLIHRLRPPAVRSAMDAAAPQAANSIGFLSLVVMRTLDQLVFVTACALLLWAIVRLPAHRAYHLFKPLFVGFAFNALFGPLVLASADRGPGITGILDYPMRGGTFANTNHLATLLLAMIPLAVYFGQKAGRALLSLLLVIYILSLLLAAGSMAGLIIGAVIASAAIFLAVQPGEGLKSRWPLYLVGGWAALSLAGIWYRLDTLGLDAKLSRSEYLRVSAAAIKENFPFGTGYGTFETTYPIYEPTDSIGLAIVNHVHNDFVELVYEGGVIAAALIVLYLLLLAKRLYDVRGNALMRAIGLSILGILLHSVVDYPMRTVAILFTFIVLNALLFHRGLVEHVESLKPAPKPQVPVHHRRNR